ncbi:ABC transporter ATP-binding protein [Tautonia sociabilis]|uniref:ATP-binding cassette domain-containing protein n=1 Tax=Tautonia sociabilis TaxID=2080755 RepID=A0A432MEQ2_9BACT|nr:ATP-binding cassette domain-containing protein [Tautonia sociabilis]RUL84017.1 ATP-binding cassette domain-containing protein [Tautonia sociabilis]
MRAREPLVKACGLRRRVPGGDELLLDDVRLEVFPGERLAITGPSGSGKTVLLRAISLLDPVDGGIIHWRGQPVIGDEVPAYRGQVIYLHQRPALLEGSVEENLKEPFRFAIHRARRFDREHVVALLRELGRDESFLEKPSRDLSGGEAQVVALLRAIQLRPTLLLLDEATASLDPATVAAAEDLLSRWLADAPSDRALVWVSHDAEQTRRVADRTVRMNAGQCEPER